MITLCIRCRAGHSSVDNRVIGNKKDKINNNDNNRVLDLLTSAAFIFKNIKEEYSMIKAESDLVWSDVTKNVDEECVCVSNNVVHAI
jgi:hypothetical protein